VNIPCLIGFILCSPLPDAPDKVLLFDRHADRVPSLMELIGQMPPKMGKEREERILSWLKQGYWPRSQSRFKPIQVIERGHRLVYWVSADYLNLGSDADSILIPMAWPTVRALVAEWNVLLPTAKMVDQIYQQSDRIYWPHAYAPSDVMSDKAVFVEHDAWIRARPGFDFHEFPLVSGHKKDLVAAKPLLDKPQKLAIYGWHTIANGVAIQPQSLWHADFYVDYSHGIRLVAPKAELDGKVVSIAKVLKDPELASLISFEGAYDICAVLRYACDEADSGR
jgi:hypothetical protein